MVGGSDGFHRLLKVTVLGIRGSNVKLGFEVDAGCSRPSFGGVGTNPSRPAATPIEFIRGWTWVFHAVTEHGDGQLLFEGDLTCYGSLSCFS